MKFEKLNIIGNDIGNVDYEYMLEFIDDSILNNRNVTIGYSTAHIMNTLYSNKPLQKKYKSLSLTHPDGVGVYLASKILYGKNCFKSRITGSDFYPQLAKRSIEKSWKLFFFGDEDNTLKKIYNHYPSLNICGAISGFNFNSDEVINKINSTEPDILVIGLGFPKQLYWLEEFKDRLNFKTAILVGDGIKVFAGVKRRGSKLIQKLGLEWFIRFMNEPVRLFKRYIIGNPLFIYRILKQKINKKNF